MLHIEAERREEEKREKGYLRRELRYGSLAPLPEGVTEADIDPGAASRPTARGSGGWVAIRRSDL